MSTMSIHAKNRKKKKKKKKKIRNINFDRVHISYEVFWENKIIQIRETCCETTLKLRNHKGDSDQIKHDALR